MPMRQRSQLNTAGWPAWLGILVVGVMVAAGTVGADESQRRSRVLDPDPTTMTVMEIASLTIEPLTATPMVLLRNPDSGDLVPIMIGAAEARAILLALHGSGLPRPMTHDLLHDVIEALGGQLQRVYVDDLVDNTFLGILELRDPDRDERVLVDSRPSDALALALRADVPILVSAKVIDRAREQQYAPLDENQVAAALGLTVVQIDADIRESLALPERPGVIISQARGAARDAGLEAGMMILKVNDKAVDSPLDFLEQVGAAPAGETVRITVWVTGRERVIEFTAPAARQPTPPGRGPAISA